MKLLTTSYVYLDTTEIAPGQWTASARVPAILWSAQDGNLTLLPDGVLELRFPSNGIIEYWRRGDGASQTTSQSAPTVSSSNQQKRVFLVFRKVMKSGFLPNHWGLAIEKTPGSSGQVIIIIMRRERIRI
jgi:hypothetical protein